MAIQIVFETHSITEDNERGIATGWHPGRLSDKGRLLAKELGARRRNDRIRRVLVIGHIATSWALEHYLNGVPLEDLAGAQFTWQGGWEYLLP